MQNDYDHYNSAPEGLKEITSEEWFKGIFHYCIKQPDSRQVRDNDNNQYFDLRLFPVPNFTNKTLGYAIKNDWFNNGKYGTAKVTFCRYGTDEDWRIFEGRFAAQFAGDNS